MASAAQHSLRLYPVDADLVAQHGARCMDGSPGGFYFAPAASSVNASRLVIHLEGGGECRSARACATWAFHSGSSIAWPSTKPLPGALRNVWPGSPMDPSPSANPDFHDWAKLFLPYCSADLHAGTRKERSAALGGWFFSGHNLISGALAQLRRLPPSVTNAGDTMSHVLVTGSSAGGIGALLHADWFAGRWPRAVLKVSPEAGLFYPPVASVRDATRHRETSPSDMAMHDEWQPFLHQGCAGRHNGSIAVCSNAHRLLEHIEAPLFLRENLFDVAKLANCGLDVHAKLGSAAVAYLRHWGQVTRATIETRRARHTDGFFAPSCLAHAANLRFSSSPMVGGVALIDAIHHWFFVADGGSLQYAIDGCGDLPCTNETGRAGEPGGRAARANRERCPLLDSVRECKRNCKLARRKRRIRLGLNPEYPGHNVCQLEESAEGASASDGARSSAVEDAPAAAQVEGVRLASGVTTVATTAAAAWHDRDDDDEATAVNSGAGLAHVNSRARGAGHGGRAKRRRWRMRARARATERTAL